MKIIHLADEHFAKETQDLALASLECALEAGAREQIDAWVFAGDLFDRGVANSAASGFTRLVNIIQRMLDVAPILSVEGTVSHDLPGAYAVLCELKAKNRFINLRPDHEEIVAGILFMGMPEAGKEWLLAGIESMSAEESMRKLMEGTRSILLGLGAIRAQHPEIPCVFLYHGTVAGASMQNGQIVGAQEIVIGREDLELVGFDVACLGHIHLEQKIDGVEAYYPGPAYHTDWGHLGQCGFNLVTLDAAGLPPKIERLPFPHPRRAKFTVTWPEPVGEAVESVQAWVCIKATKEEAQKIDTAAILEAYREMGALEGSRVTVEIAAAETVRAPEITEKRRLREKLQVYAEASSQTLNENVLQKADQLELEAAERGSAEGMHFRIRRIRLRGAEGIWKGLRQDEIDIDLDKHQPGLIAMIGVNGVGKSTLIENMHPYPSLLTRDGKLQDHFRLRDSARELWFTDERTGTEYRALMEIDGANANGAVKYHLFRNGEPITNGRKEDYEAAIERMIGSLPLFLRSAFVSQRPTKNNPDLSDATKGEKKAIFRELAGLDYLQAHAENAKGKAAGIEDNLRIERGRIEVIEGQLAALPGIKTEQFEVQGKLDWENADLKNMGEKVKQLKAGADALAATVSEQRSIQERIDGLMGLAAQQQQIIGVAQEEIARYQAALEGRGIAQKVDAEYAQLKEREGKENEYISKINAERSRISAEYGNAFKAHSTTVRGLEATRTRLRAEKARLESNHAVLLSQSTQLGKELEKPLTDECPTCGAAKEHQKKDLNAGREEKKVQLREISEKIHALGSQIMSKEGEIIAITDPPAPVDQTPPAADLAPLKCVRSAIAALNIEEARRTLATAQEAATRIEETEKRKREAEEGLSGLEDQLGYLESQIDATIQLVYEEALEKLEEARAEYGEAQKVIAGLEAEIKTLDKRIEELTALEHNLGVRKVAMEEQQAEAAEWRYLEAACGPDGIQALELDAMGPGISEVANRLLSAAYGSRFSIELRTTRIAGKGSRTKQVEDFAIIVLDNELMTEQPIETLSGGESVWIKYALYSAFSIIRDRSTGIRFLTMFRDEADGALDPESRQHYFSMLEAAHRENGTRHTIVITHSPEIQEMILQRIEMRRTSK